MNGQKIRQLREEKKMSQDELAKSSNVSRATISFIENGTADDVKLGTLRKLAKALQVAITDFFT